MIQGLINWLRNRGHSGQDRVLILYFIHSDALDDGFLCRLSASLRSLSPLPRHARIAIADYSTRPCIPDELIEEYALEYIHQPASLPFNRSWSINFAFRHFSRPTDSHVLFSDPHLVFPPGFVVDAVAALDSQSGIVIPKLYYLDKEVCAGELSHAVLLAEKSRSWRTHFSGACLCPVQLFEQVRGFDEQYVGWGAEDNDFINRVTSVGATVLKLPEFEVLHLDHPRTAEQQTELVTRNRRRLAKKKSGEIPMIEPLPWGEMAPAATGAEPAVTIILPVFNAGTHLPQCIESLKAQTLTDIEFLFVDDGSTDNSLALLEEFRSADPRVRIHRMQHNGGAGVARNAGLDLARGRYVRFVDADDIIPAESTEAMYSVATRENAEIVRGNCMAFREGSGRPGFPARTIFQVGEQAGLVFRDANFHGLPHFHVVVLFDRHFLEKHALRYPDLRMSEDPVFLLQVLFKSVAASTISDIVYRYRAYKRPNLRILGQSEMLDNLEHFLLLKRIWLSENKLDDWQHYLRANFWWFWKHFIDGDRQKILLVHQKARQVLENVPDDQLACPDFAIDWDIVKAVRDMGHDEVAAMLPSQ